MKKNRKQGNVHGLAIAIELRRFRRCCVQCVHPSKARKIPGKTGYDSAMGESFGALLRRLRLRSGFGLRAFASKIGELAPNYAKVEAGVRSPWTSDEKLLKVAASLGLAVGSEEWDRFFLAAGGYRSLPPDIRDVLKSDKAVAILRMIRAELDKA